MNLKERYVSDESFRDGYKVGDNERIALATENSNLRSEVKMLRADLNRILSAIQEWSEASELVENGSEYDYRNWINVGNNLERLLKAEDVLRKELSD